VYSASVMTGASTFLKSLRIPFLFPLICFAYRDHVSGVLRLCPCHNNHAVFQMPDRDDPFFMVLETLIAPIICLAVEHLAGVLEVQTT